MSNLLYDAHNKDFFNVIELSTTGNQASLVDSLEKIYSKIFQLFPDTVLLVNHNGIIDEIPIRADTDSDSGREFKVNQSIFNYFPHSIHNKLYDAILNVIDNETAYSFRHAFFIKQNEYHSEINFLPLSKKHFILFIKDVTSNILVQKALSQSEHLFRSVWQSSYDGLRLIKQSGEIYAVNNAYCNMVGCEAQELLDKQYYSVYSEFENIPGEIQLDEFNKCSIEKNIGSYTESKLKLNNGKTILVEIFNTIINPLPNDNLNLNGENHLLSIFRNITDKKLAEKKLLEAQKFAGFGEMSAYMTHELKTPLATIKLNLQILKDLDFDPFKKNRSLDLMLNEVIRLERLIQSVLNFSKNKKTIPVKIDIKLLFQNIVESLHSTVQQKGIKIKNKLTNYVITGDYQKLHCAFLNLIQNSIDAIHSNGTIELESQILDDKSGVIIYFKDNGCGIKDRDRIYDPFFSTKDSGTGLGLTIVKKIIEQHQGKIVLYETSSSKTIFEVYLPSYE